MTVGLVAGEIMGYLFIVKTFPILHGVPPEEWLEGAEAAEAAPAPTPAPGGSASAPAAQLPEVTRQPLPSRWRTTFHRR